jgi:hypothetical protein
LALTIVFDPSTDLPYIIRLEEEHPIFGPSTYDLQLSNYTVVGGVQFPQRFQTIYDTPLGSNAVLEDFLVESIDFNPSFPIDFFQGLPANESDTPKAAPFILPGTSYASIGESFSNMISGMDSGDAGNVSASHPIDDVTQFWNLVFDASGYSQLIMEFEDGVIVADAPPIQSLAVIQWVQENLKKPITHLWVSLL